MTPAKAELEDKDKRRMKGQNLIIRRALFLRRPQKSFVHAVSAPKRSGNAQFAEAHSANPYSNALFVENGKLSLTYLIALFVMAQERLTVAKIVGFYNRPDKIKVIEFDDGFQLLTTRDSLNDSDLRQLEDFKNMLDSVHGDVKEIKATIEKIRTKIGVT